MTAFHAVAEAPVAALADEVLAESPVLRLLADPDAERVLVLVAEPRQPVVSETPGPVATVAVAEDPDEGESPGPVYVSDRRRVTGPGELPAHTPLPQRLRGTPTFALEISLPGAAARRLQSSVGAIEISNADRGLDAWLAYAWEGWPITLRVGGTYDVGRTTEMTLLLQDYPILWRGTVDSVSADATSITLRVRSPLALLEQPLLRQRYQGTGGAEGGVEIEGTRKPIVLGRRRNVRPVLVDGGTLLYQVHDGSVEAIPAVRDRGAPLTAAGDQGDLAALLAWTQVGGEYATSLETGFLRLGGPPSGQVTADVDGDNVGGFVAEPRDVARRLATRYGPLDDPTGLDLLSFATFPSRGVGGYALGDREQSALQAVEDVIHGVDGWVSVDREGRLAIGPLRAPQSAPISAVYTDGEIQSISQEVGTRGSPLPLAEVRVAYRRNETVQDADALAAALSAADRDALATRARFATASAGGVRSVHPMAIDLEIESHLDTEPDALALATAILARQSQRRQIYRLSVERSAATESFKARPALRRHRPGDVIEVTSTRAALTARRLLLIGIVEHASGRVDLTAWG